MFVKICVELVGTWQIILQHSGQHCLTPTNRNICNWKQKLQQTTRKVNRGESKNIKIRRWEQKKKSDGKKTRMRTNRLMKIHVRKKQRENKVAKKSVDFFFWFKREDKWEEIDSGLEERENVVYRDIVVWNYTGRNRSSLPNTIHSKPGLFVSP